MEITLQWAALGAGVGFLTMALVVERGARYRRKVRMLEAQLRRAWVSAAAHRLAREELELALFRARIELAEAKGIPHE